MKLKINKSINKAIVLILHVILSYGLDLKFSLHTMYWKPDQWISFSMGKTKVVSTVPWKETIGLKIFLLSVYHQVSSCARSSTPCHVIVLVMGSEANGDNGSQHLKSESNSISTLYLTISNISSF